MDFINETDHFDQHFLVDKKIIDQFVNIANINDQDVIVEIGPGKGNITQLIASKCKYLYCIELDERLRPFLQSLCQKYNNMEVIYGSALSVCIPKCNKIITSLPYSIIEPFMHKVLKCDFQELYMIIGNHFALNVETRSVTKLGLFTNCFFHFERIMDIKPDSFFPAPRVKSSMIKLMIKKEEEIEDDVLLFFRYLFGLDHKKIKNALVESFILLAQKDNLILTQREAREKVSNMNLSEEILETKFEVCSNLQLEELYKSVQLVIHDKGRFRRG